MPELRVIQEPGGEFDYGESPSASLLFKVLDVMGDGNEYLVYSALMNETAPLYDLFGNGLLWIKRDRIHFKLRAPRIWEAAVSYGAFSSEGEPEYTFEAGGTTRHVTQSLHTYSRHAPPGQEPTDHEGAIGVTENGDVTGVDVPGSAYSWSELHVLPNSWVTPAYRLMLGSHAGRVNQAVWGVYSAGTVLYRHTTGGRRGLGDWPLRFHFQFSPDAENIQVGKITVPHKPGWAYLWTQYRAVEDTTAHDLAHRPCAAYVEQVFQEMDFGLLGI